METYIALLRGINVGGHKKILMADLRRFFEKLNFKNVKTYIQSGNVIFQSNEEKIEVLESKIKGQILNEYGFEVSVLVKTHSEIEDILNICPFKEGKKDKSYFIVLHSNPDKKLVNSTMEIKYPNEEFHIINSCVYIYYSLGSGKAKCGTNFFEKKLKVSATARNYNTLNKLVELSN
ncbi:MAG: DUF1697 domain-containing protein [Flavobacteriaceae bacterium]|nr:DUF1697 domain-containing protein [Bacteroidia bacterium]NNL16817.1 DUF1697 domain-containing protein [Flavobacteriaceae bacterium]